MLKVSSAEVRFYEPGEYDRLVASARVISPQHEGMVLLGGDAGLRTGEMIGLKWSDIDFTLGVIHIRRAVWRGHVKSLRHLVRDEVLYREG